MIPDYDLCIIGGGVNGAGIARDAAGRGLAVLLLEQGDLAQATSSASTKLIHGGLRYLEHLEFRLVHESLLERDVLLSVAPHIIWPLNFVLPHAHAIRPFWMLRLGLKLYDLLAARESAFKKSGEIALTPGDPLQEQYSRALGYADGWVEDSRLTILNALDAYERGATIKTRTRCTALRPDAEGHVWCIETIDETTGEKRTWFSRMVVNAAGPWVRDVLDRSGLARSGSTPNVRLVKGSHIIVPRLHRGDEAYMLQQPDRRIVFAIPYERDFTLIGTTDADFEGDPAAVAISPEEIAYLCAASNRYFKTQIQPGDVVHSYSGVRPLFDDGTGNASKVTRDYHLTVDHHDEMPLLSVFGGKITTYRRLAEQAVNRCMTVLNQKSPPWTSTMPLPGGNFYDGNFPAFVEYVERTYTFLPTAVARRYARAYGTRVELLMQGRKTLKDMGQDFGDGVFEAELRYMMKTEWARTLEDIIWRRSKLLLHIRPETKRNIEAFLKQQETGARHV